MKELKKYYKNCKLWLPRYPQWRIWKMRIDDGTKKGKIIKIKDNIRDEKTLRKWLLKLLPKDVYYSSGCFLDPTKVKGNQTSNYLLFRDIPFDLDAEKPYGIEELDIIRISTIKLINSLREKLNQKPKYILYTGGKGTQVIYEFENLDERRLLEFLRFKGVDPEITLDKFRVIRCPLTVNKRGKVATFLTEKDLNKGMPYILNKSKTIHSPQNFGDRAGKRKLMTNPPRQNLMGRESGTAQTDSTRAIYITNEVMGTKRFIPILKYDYKIINPKKELQKLSDKYGLNEWFLIKTNGTLFCISLASFDKRRLSKILNSTNSMSNLEFIKLKKIFMRISSYNDKKDTPIPIGIIYLNTEKEKDFLYSKPHLDLLKYFNFSPNPFMKYIGYNKPRILEVCKR